MNLKVSNYINKLDSLFDLAKDIDNDEVKGHFAKYLCVRISGLIEVYFKAQIGDYVERSSPKEVANCVNKQFNHFTNIRSDKIDELLKVFSSDWSDEFSSKMNEELSSSLNSIIGNRHLIAHGDSDNISMANVSIYYDNVKKILNILDHIITKKRRR